MTRLSIDNVEQNKRLETLESENEDTADRLNITELEVANLKDKYDLLSSQNKIFESSIETIEARLDILEKNSGTGIIFVLRDLSRFFNFFIKILNEPEKRLFRGN